MRVCSALFIICISALATVVAQETKIKRSELPRAVEKAVADQTHGAVIRGFSKEIENGQTYYEVEMTVDGHSKDVLMNTAGAVVEVEEEVAFNSLPKTVQDGLMAKVSGGRVGKVESITKHNQLVAYEAQVTTGGRKMEIQVGPDGQSLDHEE